MADDKQAQLRQALANPNMRRMLYAIAQAEGTWNQPNQGANTLVGYGSFDSYADHPRKVVKVRPGLHSSAAGRYQIIQGTWDNLKKQYGFSDFSPENQDLAAVALIAGRGALDDVIKGDWAKAIPKLNKEWASFPGDVYAQGGKNMKQMLEYLGADPKNFNSGGSAPKPAEPVPVPNLFENTMTASAPGAPHVPSLFGDPWQSTGGLSMNYNGQQMFAIPETDGEAAAFKSLEAYDEDLRGKMAQLLGQIEEAEQQQDYSRQLFGRYPTDFDDRILRLIDEA